MDKVIETKSQMIMRIAELSEANERLEAENERIKRDFLKQNQWLQDQKKEIDELKAENEKLKSDFDKCMDANKYHFDKWCKCEQCLQKIKDIADRTDGNHPASVINMVSVIRHTINSVIGVEE